MNCMTCFGWVIVQVNMASDIMVVLFCYVSEIITVCIIKNYKVNENPRFLFNVQFDLLPFLQICQCYRAVVVHSLCVVQLGTTDLQYHTFWFTFVKLIHLPSVYVLESMCTNILIEEFSTDAYLLMDH